MTQVLNEEFSALNAMNAKLNDLANRCQQKMDSASKSCTDCIRNSGCQVSYDITHTCLCNMQRFLKSLKWYFLNKKK